MPILNNDLDKLGHYRLASSQHNARKERILNLP